MICIVTITNDLHALTIQRAVRLKSKVECHIIECDQLAQRNSLSLRITGDNANGICSTSEGQKVDLSFSSVLWLRRPQAPQEIRYPVEDRSARIVIDNDCAGALRGLLICGFQGKWISSFDALIRGSDKISQLCSAAACGFRIPDTLVTQSRDEVVNFARQYHSHGIVVKTIVGAEGPFLLTRKINNPEEFEEESFEAAPAIYQECIAGNRHIRLLCFGNQSLACSITSQDLDWRPNLQVPVAGWHVPDEVHKMVRGTLDHLGLAMGVVDLKETPEGELVWLEVNPQGQFLFLEPLTKVPFTEMFAEYLISSSHSV